MNLDVRGKAMLAYKNKFDAWFGLALTLVALLCVLILLAHTEVTLGFWYDPEWRFDLVQIFVLYGFLLFAVLLTKARLLRGSIPTWLYLLTLASGALVLMMGQAFWGQPMHCIAKEYFDSHGRFYCSTYDSEIGGPAYFFRDDNAPWILFGPLLLLNCCHWFYRRPSDWIHARAWLEARGTSAFRWVTTYK